MSSTLSRRLQEARGLMDLILPKPGEGKKTDFVVLNSGNGVIVRCLNDRHYSFRTKVAHGFKASFEISDAECVISLPGNVGRIEVRSDLRHDKVVLLEVGGHNPDCICGNCNSLIVRLPSVRTGFVTDLDNPISSMQPFNLGAFMPSATFMGGTSPFGVDYPVSGLFGEGSPGLRFIDLGEFAQMFGDGLGRPDASANHGRNGGSAPGNNGRQPGPTGTKREPAGAGAKS